MAKAYICDRCGDAKRGASFARVFLERHEPGTHTRTNPPKVIERREDLCEPCARAIENVIKTAPPREA